MESLEGAVNNQRKSLLSECFNYSLALSAGYLALSGFDSLMDNVCLRESLAEPISYSKSIMYFSVSGGLLYNLFNRNKS